MSASLLALRRATGGRMCVPTFTRAGAAFFHTSGVAQAAEPTVKPSSPNFGSGPTKKFPGYDVSKIPTRAMGRSHRSKLGLGVLQDVIAKSRDILQIPDDYHLGLVPASDTGAFEMAMWSLLGARPIDVCYWDSFGKGWQADIQNELKLENVTVHSADYGQIPDLKQTNPDNDIVFTWNGTTSGVRVPNADWISADRKGLTLCDATSAVFAMPMDWAKLDVTTYSWQKALGGEGAHGVIVLSPRAVERLNSYTPPWPMPKIFKLAKKGKFSDDVFKGKVINTPSMLAAEDCLLALDWVKSIGGQDGMIKRSEESLGYLDAFVQKNSWAHFLAADPAVRSSTSVCLTLDLAPAQLKQFTTLLQDKEVAYDIGAYRDAPDGLRIWCGSTVEPADVKILCDWLEYAHAEVTGA